MLTSRTFLVQASPVFLNPGCTMETPREHLKIEMPGLIPGTRESELSGVGPGHGSVLKLRK